MISCKEYVEIRKKELKEKIKQYKQKPHLVVIQIDDNSASNSYIKGKRNDCHEIDIKFTHVHLDSNLVMQEYLEECISDFGKDLSVHGIIIQLPIPDKYDLQKLLKCIPPEKDVDGFRKDSCFKPCTPLGIINWLKYNDYNFIGKNAVVVGRSEIVGKPLVNMLIDEGATVTCCNSHSDLAFSLTCQDLICTAIGKPKYFNNIYFDYYFPPEVIIDIGINRDENGKLCGDIDRENVEQYYSSCPYTENNPPYITPVPNGVGLLTRLALMENVIEACLINN